MTAEFIKHNTPPGINSRAQIRFLVVGLVCSVLYSTSFFGSYFRERGELYDYQKGKLTLIEGAKIADFHDILGLYYRSSIICFFILAVCMLAYVIYYYLSFRQGSMSIYLMKRLPKKSEMHRRALTLPCLSALICIFAALITTFVYFAFYILLTPEACLPSDVWQQLWRIKI